MLKKNLFSILNILVFFICFFISKQLRGYTLLFLIIISIILFFISLLEIAIDKVEQRRKYFKILFFIALGNIFGFLNAFYNIASMQ